jgi:hypothetical protein
VVSERSRWHSLRFALTDWGTGGLGDWERV